MSTLQTYVYKAILIKLYLYFRTVNLQVRGVGTGPDHFYRKIKNSIIHKEKLPNIKTRPYKITNPPSPIFREKKTGSVHGFTTTIANPI